MLVDYSEYDEANKIYEKWLDEYIQILKANFEEQQENILTFPYLSYQNDAAFILWTLISKTIWNFENRVNESIKKNYFLDIEPVRREFTTVATAFTDDTNPRFGFYGCDGIQSNSVLKYSFVHFSNIYGARKDKHFACGHNITNDDKLLLTLKAIEGTLSIDELSDTEKEVAAKTIECGYIRKCGNLLLPKIVAYERRFDKKFHNLAIALNENTQVIVNKIAKELSVFMSTHIPKHLINEYEYYSGCIAGARFLHEVIESCINAGLLSKPQNQVGAEGVLLVIEK